MTPSRRPARILHNPPAAPIPLPGLHLGTWPSDTELRRRIEAANAAGYRTVLDGPGLEELMKSAEDVARLV